MLINSIERAKLILATFKVKGDEISYDEALTLYKDAVSFLDHAGYHDPATSYFTHQRNEMIKLMDALNWIYDLKRTDHMDKVRVMIVGYRTGIVDELDIWVVKSGSLSKTTRLSEIKLAAEEFYVKQGLTKLNAAERIEELVIC